MNEYTIPDHLKHPCVTRRNFHSQWGSDLEQIPKWGWKNPFNFITGNIYFHCFQSKKSSGDGNFTSKLYSGNFSVNFFPRISVNENCQIPWTNPSHLNWKPYFSWLLRYLYFRTLKPNYLIGEKKSEILVTFFPDQNLNELKLNELNWN